MTALSDLERYEAAERTSFNLLRKRRPASRHTQPKSEYLDAAKGIMIGVVLSAPAWLLILWLAKWWLTP